MVVLVIAASIALTLSRQPEPTTEQDAPVITHSTDAPDEQRPDKATYQWTGRNYDPRHITLPSIGAEGFIQNVGVDQNQEIAVPTNTHLAGWFVDSVRPGEKGLSIIDGHVSGRESSGIFEKLGDLQIDDVFYIEFGDNSRKEFKITAKYTVPEAEAAARIFDQDPNIANQLNLVTCAGEYNQDTRRFDERTIVTASAQ